MFLCMYKRKINALFPMFQVCFLLKCLFSTVVNWIRACFIDIMELNILLCIVQLLGHCPAMPQLVPISVIFTRDGDIAYHVAIQ